MKTPLFESSGLSYSYPDGTQGLSQVSFSIAEGERIALLGANGAGKSTLLLLLAGIFTGEGDVKIEGVPFSKGNQKNLRRKVGILFQDPDDQLFCPNILEDAVFGPLNLGVAPKEAEHRAHSALEKTGISHLAHRPAHHLSLGERRRAALASVLSMQPSILLMDEPTSNLDPRGRRELLELLKSLGGSQLVATHNLEFAAGLCSRALILKEGRMVFDGLITDLLANEALLDANGLR